MNAEVVVNRSESVMKAKQQEKQQRQPLFVIVDGNYFKIGSKVFHYINSENKASTRGLAHENVIMPTETKSRSSFLIIECDEHAGEKLRSFIERKNPAEVTVFEGSVNERPVHVVFYI